VTGYSSEFNYILLCNSVKFETNFNIAGGYVMIQNFSFIRGEDV
jgi:hypothetical protein